MSDKKKLRHELRTPLNQIIGYSELLAEETQDAGHTQYSGDLAKIGDAARNMLRLVDHLFEAGLVKQDAVVEAAAPVGRNASEVSEPSLRSTTFGTGRHVLVVDDDPNNVEFLARQLQRRGFEVTTAQSGPQALEHARAHDFDLVLLDVMMPGMSGLEVLQQLRQSKSASELPVVMATALDQSGDIVEALKLGANDYVTKPLDLPVVLARLETQLDLKRAREQIEQLAWDLEARNRLIRSTFGRYMSEEVVHTLLETPEGLEIGGTRRVVTILMSDLRGFTGMSDRLQPDEVMAVLNDYLAEMVEVVDQHRGTIIEFIGDAVFVLFGAPFSADDDARRAVACAISMQRAMAPINARLEERGLPKLEMGIALNTGEVIVGNIGSLKRSKYGAVGRHVNLTARIESFGVGGQILASSATIAAAGADVVTGARTSFHAKGFADKVEVAEIRGLRDADLFVPSVEVTLTAIDPALPVFIKQLDGKVLSEAEHEARLTHVSATGAVVQSPQAFAAFSDLKLQLTGRDGARVPDDVYAKVMAVDGGALTVRFTSVPPGAAALLKSLAETATAA